MSDADHLDFRTFVIDIGVGRTILMIEEFTDGLSLGLDGAGRGFLYENITVLTMLESEENKINSLF